MSVESPCNRICTLDEANVCLGCFRTLDEICRWTAFSEAERARVLARLPLRREDHQARTQPAPAVSMSICERCDAQFHCGAQDAQPCWCSQLPTVEPVAGMGCLCPDCLAAAGASRVQA
jgi:hypothetical protein